MSAHTGTMPTGAKALPEPPANAPADALAVWRELADASALGCPVCSGDLAVSDHAFRCRSCDAVFPVTDGVPLLLRPGEVAPVSDRVMAVFNIPATERPRVESALAVLTKYRSYEHPEFANFFARFDAREAPPQPVPLTPDETAAAVAAVTCLTPGFPPTLRTDAPEHRSIRIRNGSDRVLFTDGRGGLQLGYQLFTEAGAPIPFEGDRSPLPCPLRPGGELTIPVRVGLPPGLTGRVVVRFHFRLDLPAVAPPANVPPVVAGAPRGPFRTLLDALRSRPAALAPAAPPTPSVRWFDAAPLAEMTVTATPGPEPFPATRNGGLGDFEVHEDVARADAFLAGIIRDLRARGVARPRILEIGAGVHPIALRACDENSVVVVSDISLVMQGLAAIMHANNPAVREGRAGFASFDLVHPPFREGTFDVICICAALHHIPDPEGFLRRVARLLAPGGRFVAVREPCLVNPYEPTYITELSNGFNEQMFELPEWSAFVARAGLTFDRADIDYGCSLKFSARHRDGAA